MQLEDYFPRLYAFERKTQRITRMGFVSCWEDIPDVWDPKIHAYEFTKGGKQRGIIIWGDNYGAPWHLSIDTRSPRRELKEDCRKKGTTPF